MTWYALEVQQLQHFFTCVTGEAVENIKSAILIAQQPIFKSVRQKECVHYNGHACPRACYYAQSAVLGQCDLERQEESLTVCAEFTEEH